MIGPSLQGIRGSVSEWMYSTEARRHQARLQNRVEVSNTSVASLWNSDRNDMIIVRWQEGFGAFCYGHSQVDAVVKYIQNQAKHHTRRTFKEEYLQMLEKFKVGYDQKYVFQ